VGDELAENSGIAWDEATFREYIKDPKAKVPGTKMIFPGPQTVRQTVRRLRQEVCGKDSAETVARGGSDARPARGRNRRSRR
jgi:cytochrome c